MAGHRTRYMYLFMSIRRFVKRPVDPSRRVDFRKGMGGGSGTGAHGSLARYGVIRSKDLVKWEDLSGQLRFPPGARHGTAFRAPRAVLQGLEDASQPRTQ